MPNKIGSPVFKAGLFLFVVLILYASAVVIERSVGVSFSGVPFTVAVLQKSVVTLSGICLLSIVFREKPAGWPRLFGTLAAFITLTAVDHWIVKPIMLAHNGAGILEQHHYALLLIYAGFAGFLLVLFKILQIKPRR